MKYRINFQLAIAAILCLGGMTLLFMGFWVEPTGKIDSSVLVAFGETMTFSGALFGVDYTYKYKSKFTRRNDPQDQE